MFYIVNRCIVDRQTVRFNCFNFRQIKDSHVSMWIRCVRSLSTGEMQHTKDRDSIICNNGLNRRSWENCRYNAQLMWEATIFVAVEKRRPPDETIIRKRHLATLFDNVLFFTIIACLSSYYWSQPTSLRLHDTLLNDSRSIRTAASLIQVTSEQSSIFVLYSRRVFRERHNACNFLAIGWQ